MRIMTSTEAYCLAIASMFGMPFLFTEESHHTVAICATILIAAGLVCSAIEKKGHHVSDRRI